MGARIDTQQWLPCGSAAGAGTACIGALGVCPRWAAPPAPPDGLQV